MLRTGAVLTSACLLVWCVVSALPARADDFRGFLEYAGVYGDTYDGVTTDDGDHLASSFGVRAMVASGRFAALYMYHRDENRSIANGTLPSGAPGTTINYPAEQTVVPLFTAVNAGSEFRLEYQPWRGPIYLGAAYSNSFNNYGFPRLSAFGVGVEVQPNPAKRLSPYGYYFYFPNQTGTFPLAAPSDPASGPFQESFHQDSFLAGGSGTIGRTGLSLRFGVYRDSSVRRAGSFNIVRDGPFIALAYRL
jgi:hypothetical protein